MTFRISTQNAVSLPSPPLSAIITAVANIECLIARNLAFERECFAHVIHRWERYFLLKSLLQSKELGAEYMPTNKSSLVLEPFLFALPCSKVKLLR